MPRDPQATRAAILRAAVAEFAEHGFAGARVDRIGAASGVNKRMLYVYFGDKAGLFDATLQAEIAAMIEAVPIDEKDLPGYAVALFDYLVEHPEALRLSLWRHLERPDGGPATRQLYEKKIASIKHLGTTTDPTDTLVLLQGMASAWLISPKDLLTSASSDPMGRARLEQHRSALYDAATRLT